MLYHQVRRRKFMVRRVCESHSLKFLDIFARAYGEWVQLIMQTTVDKHAAREAKEKKKRLGERELLTLAHRMHQDFQLRQIVACRNAQFTCEPCRTSGSVCLY